MAHVDGDRGAARRALRPRPVRHRVSFADWAAFVGEPRNSPEAIEAICGVPATDCCGRPHGCSPPAAIRRDLLRAGCDRAQPGHHDGHGDRQPGHGDRQYRPARRRRESALRGQNNVQGSCDMGSFPHELPGYRHVSDDEATRALFSALWGRDARPRTGAAHPQHAGCRRHRQFSRPVCAGRGHRPVRPRHPPRHRRAAGDGVRGGAGSVPDRDGGFRPRLPARLDVSGT